ncbi:GNAT family N-acetyltransferase [Sphingobacterium deserti]|uniref:GCN5-related N-acetyltransferase n=1 Tax=Sphingobacterium deserti TaxID=1229276 RepID=A0A0B8T2L0_9SPHI|nr:GNAT family N-acetyltransferase [Sphingobacterium deserti]KGE13103.1 GCN5-related N-acetyltransferase [Sphingobacterium deserti]
MKIYRETDRLILRELLPTDIDGMFELDSDPEVHRYLGNSPVKDKKEISAIIDFIRKQYIDYGIGRWAIVDKETHDFIGWAGLKYITDETNGHKNYYDLGYRLITRYWRKGLATEAAIASLDYGFNELDLKEIFAIADCRNQCSNNILRKIGFTSDTVFELDTVLHNWYHIDRTAFRPSSL